MESSIYFHLGLIVFLALCLRVFCGDYDHLWGFGSPTLAANLLDFDPLRLLAMPCPADVSGEQAEFLPFWHFALVFLW